MVPCEARIQDQMSSTRSTALRILLQFIRARESADPYSFRFEPQDYILPTAGGDSPSARFCWTPEVLADLQAVRVPGRDPAVVQRIGELLRGFVRAAGWQEHERHITEAIAERRPIFLTIRSSAAEMYALPWELLTLSTGQCIGEVDGLLIRFEWPESQSARAERHEEGERILVAWSAAAGGVPAAQHIAALSKACEAGFFSFSSSTDVIAHATLERIVCVLEEAQRSSRPVAVLHLLCHGAAAGDTFGLALDGEGGPAVVDAAQLRQQLAPFAATVRLVVLSACDSGNLGALGNRLGSVAQALHRCGFQSVIASRFPLSVAGSIKLTESLYGELLRGPSSLQAAFLTARKRIALDESRQPSDKRLLDWASLQLYARHEDGDDTRPIVFRPFRGLLAFQPEHRRFFFGREREIEELLCDLQALIDSKKERLLVVAGASGTGKSSLVLAGAVPRLLQANPKLSFLRMRPGSDPEQALGHALAQRPADAPALLLIDQFEEIFTQTEAPSVRNAFVSRLWALAAAPAPDLRIIITLRVDFIGRCGELQVGAAGLRLDRVAYDESHRLFIAQPQPEQLRASIELPARRVGLELQAGLLERMLADVEGEPGALPLLQDTLDVLWQQHDGRALTQSVYAAMGGVIGALRRRADAIMDKLNQEDLAIARRLLVSLVAVADDTALDARRAMALAELRNSFSDAEVSGLDRVLKELVAARLLVEDGDGQSAKVEVAHEALIRKWPRLRAWLNEDRAGLLWQRRVRQAAQEWDRQGRDESLLYRGGQLAQAGDWRRSWESRLGGLERSFLDASEELRARLARHDEATRRKERTRAQQTRFGAVVLGLLFIAALVAGVTAHRKSVVAQRKTQEARDGLLIAVAQTVRSDPTKVAMLLREVANPETRLWTQSAMDALVSGVALTTLRGHGASVTSVAWSPDGQQVATGSADHGVRIFRADGSSEQPLRLKGPNAEIHAVAWSPDGRKIAIASNDNAAYTLNADGSGEPTLLTKPGEIARAFAYSSDGRTIAVGLASGIVLILNASGSGERVRIVHNLSISALALSPDGGRIAIGSSYHEVYIYRTDGKGEAIRLTGHEGGVVSVSFSPDGKKLVSGSYDGTARVHSADGSGPPVLLSSNQSIVRTVAWSPDGALIATGGEDKQVRIFNADGSGEPAVLAGHDGRILALAFSADGKKLASGSWDGTARVFHVKGAQALTRIQGFMYEVNAVAFHPDGKRIAIGFHDGLARIRSLDGGGDEVLLRGHTSPVYSIAFSPDGRKVATASGDKTARIWNTDGHGAPIVLGGHGGWVIAIAWSPDGRALATASEDASVRIFRADGTGAPLVLKGHEQSIKALAWSRDGKRIVAGSDDKTARIFRADGASAPVVLSGHEGHVYAVAFSPDGLRVATGCTDNLIRIFPTEGAQPPVLLRGHEAHVNEVAFSPDGKKLGSVSRDSTARIWSADGTGAPVVLRGHRDTVSSLAWSPDGRRIATGSEDTTVGIWIVDAQDLMSALWNATTDCLPVEQRRELLLEPTENAQQGYMRCRQEIARRRGWPGTP